ncbi:Fis family transcriptional regulator [Bifidobacterium boum]|uniref:Fis family transcriptional regulator n=1 Tax=Bifidobacterium boum TaxID=78343 RepID=A0A086ZS10_9BIFI|nr:Fis family transcriptional regulator [Bifidobacterium boum]
MVFEFDGTKHGKLRDMQAARRAKHRAWCAAARTSPRPPTRSVCPNAPGRPGATAGHVPPAATSGRSRTGTVAAWTNPSGSTPDTCAWTSASPSPTCTAPPASAPSPGPPTGRPAPTRTPTTCRASTPPKGTDPSGYTEEHPDAAAMEPNDRPRKPPDHMKPNEKIPEPIDDTATSTPTDTINTNCQQRCCDDH